MRREFAANGFTTEDREFMLVEDKEGRMVGMVLHFKSRTPLARVDVPYFVANGAMARNIAKAVRQPETA